MPGQGGTNDPTIVDCRERCEGIDGYTKFAYSAHGNCSLGDDSAGLKKTISLSRSVAGFVDQCGHPSKYAIWEGTEIQKAKNLGNARKTMKEGTGCPLLYYQDGVLQDISNLADEGYLYGGPGGDNYAKINGMNHIKVITTTAA